MPEGKLTPTQYEIMELLWEAPDAGKTVAEIWEAIGQRRELTRTTIQNLVDRLVKRSWLTRQKGVGGFRHLPVLDREKTTRSLAEGFVDEFFAGSASELVMSLFGSKRLKPCDLLQLRTLLDAQLKRRKKLGRFVENRQMEVRGMWPHEMSTTIGLYVWNLLIAATGVSALGIAFARLFRGERPLQRYRLLCGTLFLLLLGPLLIGITTLQGFGAVPVRARTALSATRHLPVDPPTKGRPSQTERELENEAVAVGQAMGANESNRFGLGGWFGRLSLIAICIWISGSMLVASRWVLLVSACRRLRNRSTPVHDRRLESLMGRACNAVQLDHVIPVFTSELVGGPMSLGVRQPIVILPKGLSESLGDEQLLWVLIHEAAHIARLDIGIAWIQQMTTCLYWWNPILPVVHAEIRRVREQICDDYVVRSQQSACAYAQVLVEVAEWCLTRPLPATAPTMHFQKNEIAERIIRLTEGGSAMNRKMHRTAMGAACLAVGLSAVLMVLPALRAASEEMKSDPVTLSDSGNPIHTSTEAKKKKENNRLSHNDGTAEGKRSIAGAAEFVKFTAPAEMAKVSAVRIHGSRYGYPQPPKEDFVIYFLNDDMSETMAMKMVPYSRFKRGPEEWVEVKFPKPIEVPKEFWVGVDFRAEQTKGVYLSYDQSTDGSHSRIGLPGREMRKVEIGGDWMIEVVLAK